MKGAFVSPSVLYRFMFIVTFQDGTKLFQA